MGGGGGGGGGCLALQDYPRPHYVPMTIPLSFGEEEAQKNGKFCPTSDITELRGRTPAGRNSGHRHTLG